MAPIENLAAELPGIEIVQREDEGYGAHCQTYSFAAQAKPLAIAIPKTAEEVASIVKCARRTGASVSVRGGGHDMFGRALVDGAIAIDVRALNDVKVDRSAGQAIIGGGVQAQRLAEVLAEHECVTPCPNIGSVGYIGYATTGGYGQMAHKLGLGVDHLLAAKIVDAEGSIVQADEDAMRGIRGAGGNFGVVIEATIKVYPFSQFLAGPIIFESSDFRVSMHNVQNGMEALVAKGDCPPELDVQPLYTFLPPMGSVYGALFMWAGPDIERGRKYLDKVTSFHPVVMNQVDTVTVSKTHELNKAIAPERSYCQPRAVNVRRVTPEIYKILVEGFTSIPHDPAAMLTWHEVRPCSPSVNPSTSLPSVFNARESHTVIEILANCIDKANVEAVTKWGHTMHDELLRAAPKEIMETTWLASTPADEMDSLEKFYGEDNARFLRWLKKEKDPNDVFTHALPNLQ